MKLQANYKTDSRYLEEIKWYECHPFPESQHISVILEYARHEYDGVLQSLAEIDAKADSLFRFSATLATVVIAGAGLFSPEHLPGWRITPCLIAFGMSIGLAIWAKRTAEYPRPVSVRDLLELPQEYRPDVILAASYHTTFVGIAAVGRWKARRVDAAMFSLTAAVILLSLTLIPFP